MIEFSERRSSFSLPSSVTRLSSSGIQYYFMKKYIRPQWVKGPSPLFIYCGQTSAGRSVGSLTSPYVRLLFENLKFKLSYPSFFSFCAHARPAHFRGYVTFFSFLCPRVRSAGVWDAARHCEVSAGPAVRLHGFGRASLLIALLWLVNSSFDQFRSISTKRTVRYSKHRWPSNWRASKYFRRHREYEKLIFQRIFN